MCVMVSVTSSDVLVAGFCSSDSCSCCWSETCLLRRVDVVSWEGSLLSPVTCFIWDIRWALRWPDVRNLISQSGHLKGLAPTSFKNKKLIIWSVSVMSLLSSCLLLKNWNTDTYNLKFEVPILGSKYIYVCVSVHPLTTFWTFLLGVGGEFNHATTSYSKVLLMDCIPLRNTTPWPYQLLRKLLILCCNGSPNNNQLQLNLIYPLQHHITAGVIRHWQALYRFRAKGKVSSKYFDLHALSLNLSFTSELALLWTQ